MAFGINAAKTAMHSCRLATKRARHVIQKICHWPTNVGPPHHQTDIDNAYLMVICHQNQKNKANVKATNRITTD